jgi:hypothetical protein
MVYTVPRFAVRSARPQGALQASGNPVHESVGYWLETLTENMSITGTGTGRKALARQADLELKDPEIVGAFRFAVDDKDFDKMFLSKKC